jgi:hypothetical protein
MGWIEIVHQGRRVPLPAECWLGRSETSTVRFERADVSNEHASLRWTGAGWELRDLGSRNGTFLDGARLSPGKAAPLAAGARIRLGCSDAELVLLDDQAPLLAAVELDSGAWHAAEGSVLGLPSEEAPELSVLELPECGWVCQSEDETWSVRSGETVTLGARRFRLHLPTPVKPTLDAAPAPDSASGAPRLVFAVSKDEEYVEAELVAPDETRRSLGARAHHYLLLSLARLRARDAEGATLSPSEQGWVHLEDLGQMLHLDKNHLYVSIHRARRQLAELSISAAASVVEARPGTGLVRYGYPEFEIRSM